MGWDRAERRPKDWRSARSRIFCGVPVAAALSLPAKAGLDGEFLLRIPRGSTVAWTLNNCGPRMLQDGSEVASALDVFVKDVGRARRGPWFPRRPADCGSSPPKISRRLRCRLWRGRPQPSARSRPGSERKRLSHRREEGHARGPDLTRPSNEHTEPLVPRESRSGRNNGSGTLTLAHGVRGDLKA